jgi:Sortase domain
VKKLLPLLVLLTACTPWVDAPGFFKPRVVNENSGSQRVVDSGIVGNVFGCDPGECTVWLAGHRSSHGSVFANVTKLRAGNVIRYGWGGDIYHYEVTGIQDIPCCDKIDTSSDLVLQTSLPGGMLRIVHAQLVWVQRL